MHFALITAPTITEFRSLEEIESKAVQEAALQPQLGILSVAAILEQWGDCPHLIDTNAEYLDFRQVANGCVDDFAEHLAQQAVLSNADVYGFGSICSTFPLSLRVARALKKIRPYATVLFGGPQASAVDLPVLEKFSFVDYILRGEVEESLPRFLKELAGDYSFNRVPGLTFRDGSTIQRTPNAPVIEYLDALPSPAYHLSEYLRGAKAASIELGRGCPFSCTFCSTNDFFRRRYRLRSPERVLNEMRLIADQYGIRHFELVHDMFTVDRKRVVAFCDVMRVSGEQFTWDCSARTDCVDEELLQEMVASGCSGLFFGIESGSVRMQRIIDKDLDPQKAEEMLRVSERLGIRTTASLIVGFPEEEWSDVDATLRMYVQSARCSRSHPQINLLAPLAGTPLYTKHAHELQLEEFCSDMSHQGLSQADEDLALIRNHPEIFPNFYMIPAPMLNREMLFELREFLGMASERFRWLLCAIAQVTALRTFHEEWTRWRRRRRGDLSKSEIRRYYAEQTSRRDFLQFVSQCSLRSDTFVNTFLQVEEALLVAAEKTQQDVDTTEARTQKANGGWNDAVSCAQGVQLLALRYDLSELTLAMTHGKFPEKENITYYATRRQKDGNVVLSQISPFLAGTLRECNGQSVQAVERVFGEQFNLQDQAVIEQSVKQLVTRLQDDGWLARI